MKILILRLRPVLIALLAIFFDRRYLRGKHFESGISGYRWAIRAIWQRNILRLARTLPFPAALTAHVSNGRKIEFDPDDLNNFQSPGTYFQNFTGNIYLGKGCYIGPNVGIITADHDPTDPERHLPAEDVLIGDKCWVGMNSIILPGVVLGPRTIVAASSVVTRSFPDGNCLLAGTPAKIIKLLPQNSSHSLEDTK